MTLYWKPIFIQEYPLYSRMSIVEVTVFLMKNNQKFYPRVAKLGIFSTFKRNRKNTRTIKLQIVTSDWVSRFFFILL